MQIYLSKKAEKFLLKADKSTTKRIKLALEGLKQKPPIGDIKSYKSMPGCFRLRVGNYRIIFYIEVDIIQVIDIDSRGQIYS
ncbi:MAG: type II toxin-antitoxin system RelE/ParE family toxin [Defluviitaleaceae bacterium]|nr:type II toxin-antitoxin system RelE/ParE family toxin [Defluviitaleaceae bacterium]